MRSRAVPAPVTRRLRRAPGRRRGDAGASWPGRDVDYFFVSPPVVEPELLPVLELLPDVEPEEPDVSLGLLGEGLLGLVGEVLGLRTSGLPASALRAREVAEPARPSGELALRPLSLQALAAAIRAAADPNVIHLRSVMLGVLSCFVPR